MKHVLEADGIVLEFRTRRILSNIYFKCETGKITGILGRNGEGKTCLMNTVYGTLNPLSKSIRFDNISVLHAFKRPDLITYLPQFNFIPSSLSLKIFFADFALDYINFEKHFPEFEGKHNSKIKNLSSGQRRLVEIYVIIKAKSEISMLDEPFSHISPIQIEKIKEILQYEKQEKGFLITDHMHGHVTDLCDSLYLLRDGKIHLTKDINDIEKLGYARL